MAVEYAYHQKSRVGQESAHSPRIVGELQKVGVKLARSTVEKYMVKRRGSGSPTWMPFLRSHLARMIAVDFFVVPTVAHRVLFVFLVLVHERRRVLARNQEAR